MILLSVFSALRFVFKLISALVGIGVGLLVIFVLFVDDLPLDPPPAKLTSPTGGPYLDMHVHVAGIGAGDSGCFISSELRDSYKYDFYLKALGVNDKEISIYGDALVLERLSKKIASSKHIEKAVVLALDGIIDDAGKLDRKNTQIFVPNDYVSKETSKYDNLLFGASINPNRPDALKQLVDAKRSGAVLVKWIPSIMHIDPADEKLIPFYLALMELDLPLLSHTGQERTFLGARDELSDPQRLDLPLRVGVTVIAAHIAANGENEGEENFYRIMPLFRKYKNLYADISSLTQINRLGYLREALQVDFLKDRLVYGSDWPLQFQLIVSPWYQMRHLPLTEMRYLSHVGNDFDRDVLLKKALGVPEGVFMRSSQLIEQRIPFEDIIKKKTGKETKQGPGADRNKTVQSPS